LTLANGLQQKARNAFASLEKNAAGFSSPHSRDIHVQTVFDAYFFQLKDIQDVCEKQFGFAGDFFMNYGRNAPMTNLAPREEVVPEKYLAQYRQAYAVFLGAESALQSMQRLAEQQLIGTKS
jgi:hypothetical protein